MSAKDDVTTAVTGMVAAVNRIDMPAARAWFTDNAVIVEDIAPYRWEGPNAVEGWLAAMAGSAQRLGVDAISMTLGDPVRIDVEGDSAYALFAGSLTMRTAVDHYLAEGLLTLTLSTCGDRWLIDTLAWSGPNPRHV